MSRRTGASYGVTWDAPDAEPNPLDVSTVQRSKLWMQSLLLWMLPFYLPWVVLTRSLLTNKSGNHVWSRARPKWGRNFPTHQKKKKKFFYFHFSHAPASWFGLLVLTRRERRKIKEQTNEQHTHAGTSHSRRVKEKECRERKKRWVVRSRCEIWHLKIYNVGVEWLQSL